MQHKQVKHVKIIIVGQLHDGDSTKEPTQQLNNFNVLHQQQHISYIRYTELTSQFKGTNGPVSMYKIRFSKLTFQKVVVDTSDHRYCSVWMCERTSSQVQVKTRTSLTLSQVKRLGTFPIHWHHKQKPVQYKLIQLI